MKQVIINIYHEEAGTSRDERKLVKTIQVELDSDKRLTSSRASKIISRELPRFSDGLTAVVNPTENGWEASRTIEPSENCAYHFSWEYAEVLKD